MDESIWPYYNKWLRYFTLGLPVSFPPSWLAPRLSSPVAQVRRRWPTLCPHWPPSLLPPYPPTYPCLYCRRQPQFLSSMRTSSLFQQLITTFIKNYSLTVLSESVADSEPNWLYTSSSNVYLLRALVFLCC